MKALVTGGGGFIGSNLVRTLVEGSHEVVVLDSFVSGFRKNVSHLDARVVDGDVRNGELVRGLAKGCDVIYHLAASVGNKRSIDFPHEDAEVNVLGTVNVLEAARANKVRKVVFSSSAGIFGELKTLPIDESHPCEPDSPYGASKLGAEKICLAYAKLYEMECVCLRYFNVFGPNQRFDAYGNVIPIFVFQSLRGETVTIFGDGYQTRDFVNVRDVVQANIKASLAPGVSGAFNLGSGTQISILQLVEAIAADIGQEVRFEFGPPRPGDVRDSLADISKARREFGYEPSHDFEGDLREYIAWARSEIGTGAEVGSYAGARA